MKFESGHAIANVAVLAQERRAKEVAMLDKPELMEKLRGLLGDLTGRVAGHNKDDISDALITRQISSIRVPALPSMLKFHTVLTLLYPNSFYSIWRSTTQESGPETSAIP